MERIVHGILFEGTRVPDAWDVRTWRKNGVMERSARQVIEWEEKGPAPRPVGWDEYLAQFEGQKLLDRLKEREQHVIDLAAAALKKAAQRAKQACRRIIIAEGFDELLTITYRENQEDRALCKKHFKEWVRRIRRAIPGFAYCASFERQDRGAMHVHLATHKLPKKVTYRGKVMEGWRLGTAIWRAIVGKTPEGLDNGLCFVGGKSKNGWPRPPMTLAQLAAYVSKYIMKDYEECPAGSNRYSRSEGDKPEKSEVLRLTNCTLEELLQVTFEMGEGDILVSWRLGRHKDSMWLVTEEAG